MKDKKSNTAKKRQKHSSQLKEQAVARSKKQGVRKTAADLGIHEGMLYAWCRQHETIGIPFEDQKIQGAELARLKREVSRLSEENAFFFYENDVSGALGFTQWLLCLGESTCVFA